MPPVNSETSLTFELRAIERSYYLQWGNGKVLKMVRTLSILAVFILLSGGSKFHQHHDFSSSYRLKEIGLRKLFGGVRQQLVLQFLVESIMISLLSMLLAFVMYVLLLPVFQDILGKPLKTPEEINVWIFPGVLIFSHPDRVRGRFLPCFQVIRFQDRECCEGKTARIR
jgi:putative ABC transport system permease protein